MEPVRIRFPQQDKPDRPLPIGMHAVVRSDDGLEVVGGDGGEPVRLCVDRRGVWMTLDGDAPGVHVNGRPIRRMAMLRAGDTIHVDGYELRLLAPWSPQPPPFPLHQVAAGPSGDRRIVLRGIGGRYHGCSITLEQPRLVGRNGDADIRIDDPALEDRHARVELVGEQLVLRDLGSARGSEVNGEQVRDALLQSGDQIAFDGRHRFVVEAPRRPITDGTRDDDAGDVPAKAGAAPAQPGRRSAWRWPWLLVSALLLALLLSALLLFGSA